MPDLIHHIRHSIRLKEYDYSLEGAYFVTIVTNQRVNLFGDVEHGEMKLSPSGTIAYEQWAKLEKRFPGSDFSSFMIMPNHVHGIVIMVNNSAESFQKNGIYKNINRSLGTLVRAYKASVSFRINAMRGYIHPQVWQSNYYEKIIRNQVEYENIWKYIYANPDRWEEDKLYG
jgi:putative transposase